MNKLLDLLDIVLSIIFVTFMTILALAFLMSPLDLDKARDNSVSIETWNGGVKTGSGSGFIYNGYVVSAWHVVGSLPDTILVYVEGRPIVANIVGAYPLKDTVILFPREALGEGFSVCDSAPKLGDVAYHYGNTMGLGLNLGKGILADDRIRLVDDFPYEVYDISVIPGDSGGPFFSEDGCIIGMVAATYVFRDLVPISRGLSIPFETLKSTLAEFMATRVRPQ